jgi:AraC-like DNA-binding protein
MALSNYKQQLDRFPLNVLHIRQGTIGIHQHAFYELVLVVSGEGRHVTAAEEYAISAGDLFLIKPGNPHGYRVESNFSLYNILYYPERLKLPLFDLADEPGYRAFFELEPELRRQFGFRKHFRLGKSQLDEIELLVQRMTREIGSNEPGHDYRAATLFMRLTERIAATFSNSTLYRENDELFRLSELVSYLERHRTEPHTVAALAEKAAMSPATLNRAFRRAVGKSPLHYLNDLRISGAEQLLLVKPELPVAAVATEFGFDDSNYFSRLFKKRTGYTPRAFRRREGGRNFT